MMATPSSFICWTKPHNSPSVRRTPESRARTGWSGATAGAHDRKPFYMVEQRASGPFHAVAADSKYINSRPRFRRRLVTRSGHRREYADHRGGGPKLRFQREGRLTADIDRDEATQEQILRYAMTAPPSMARKCSRSAA